MPLPSEPHDRRLCLRDPEADRVCLPLWARCECRERLEEELALRHCFATRYCRICHEGRGSFSKQIASALQSCLEGLYRCKLDQREACFSSWVQLNRGHRSGDVLALPFCRLLYHHRCEISLASEWMGWILQRRYPGYRRLVLVVAEVWHLGRARDDHLRRR